MKLKILILVMLFLIISCNKPDDQRDKIFSIVKPQTPYIENGCMVDAVVAMANLRLNNVGIWSKILIIYYQASGKEYSHAVCVFQYPAGSNSLWCYDQAGSHGVTGTPDSDPMDIAKQLFAFPISAYYCDR